MPRNVPNALAARMASSATTLCRLLKITPLNTDAVGITSLNRDVVFDDGNGPITYSSVAGYTPSDIETSADLSVDNATVQSLLVAYMSQGIMKNAVDAGTYNSAAFMEMVVDYENLDAGATQLSSGVIGQITIADDLSCQVELRSLVDILKQNNMVEVTSITCRARFGDARCKMPFIWNAATVDAVGAEPDRMFTISFPDDSDGEVSFADNYFVPGIISWTSGANTGQESELESYSNNGSLVLSIPTTVDVAVGDSLNIRRDCDYSKAMCIAYDNLLNMRAEPEIPRGNGTDIQAPTPGGAT